MTEKAEQYLERIARSGAGGVSCEDLASPQPAPLPDSGELVDKLQAEIDYIARITGETPDKDAVENLAKSGKEGLERLNGDGPDADIDDKHVGGLEAVIRTDGTRPVAFVRNDYIDATQPSLQQSPYLQLFGGIEENIRHFCRASGRVDHPSSPIGYWGTAFVVGEDLVMTNRHVLKKIVDNGNADTGNLVDGVTVDFWREAGPPKNDRRFKVSDILFRGLEGQGQFARLDIAILRLDLEGRALADPLPLAFSDFVQYASAGRQVYIVGYPGSVGATKVEVFDRIFQGIKAFKRLAPGEILQAAGEQNFADKDPDNWLMSHDASTLGGNSGSAIWDLDSSQTPLLGIHFAGEYEIRNYAHSFERLGTALADVPGLNIVA